MRLPDHIRVISSAYKHGVSEVQILDSLYNPYRRPLLLRSQSDPAVVLALAETEDGELFEIGYVPEKDGCARVIHAMPMRQLLTTQESYRWRQQRCGTAIVKDTSKRGENADEASTKENQADC